ncbi:MAG: hypothetical protein JW793_08900, partial [Acidobacteria bacterium]|nr:hypothetical protein [Acidobacteriota bacterium]
NVSPRLVSSAKKVIATGDKELIAAVDSGQVAVSAAVKKIDQEKQQPVMTMGSQDKPTNTASKERLPVKRAGQYVDLAILQLERILDDDPTAQSALSRLTEWIEQKQKRLQG